MPGQNAQVRYTLSAAEHVPGRDWWYPGWATEDFDMSRPGEPDGNINASGNEGRTENLLAEGTWSLSGQPDSESYVPMRAHQHGFYEQLAAPAVGVGLIELRDYDPVNDDPVAQYLESLDFGIWRDVRRDPSEYMAFDAKVADFTLTAEANKYVMFEHSGLFLRDTYMATPAEVAANAAYTGRWERRGHRRDGDENGPSVAWRVSSGGAVGVAELQYGSAQNIASLTSVDTLATAVTSQPHGLTTGDLVTISGATPAEYNVANAAITVTGAATFTYVIVDAGDEPATGTIVSVTFGADEYLIVDDWMDVYDADGATKGTRREPVQIRPIPETGDVFTIGDTWRLDPTSGKPIAVLSASGKLVTTDLQLELTLSGGRVHKQFESFSFKMGTPREAKPGVGSKYHQRIGAPDDANKWWELSFDRDLLDLDFERARTSNAVISAYAKFYGPQIGSTGFEHFAEFTFDALTVTNAGGTIQSPGDTPEQVVLRAFPATNGASLCVERYQNTVASIAPV